MKREREELMLYFSTEKQILWIVEEALANLECKN